MSAPVVTNEPNVFWPRSLGLLAGPRIAATVLLAPPQAGMSQEAWQVAAVALLMAIWWMTEAVLLPVTALLPLLVFFPLLGVAEPEAAPAPYSHPSIFLFPGGSWRGPRRSGASTAGWRMLCCAAAAEATGMILGLMVATAFLSMWVSNTATAVLIFGAVQRRSGDRLEPEASI